MNARFASVRGVCLLQLLMLFGVAVFRVSGAPVSTKEVVGKAETVAKNNELNIKEKSVSANTESASYSPKSSSNSSQPEAPVKRSLTSSKIERAPMNPTPVRSSSSVRINPVPGQMERVLSSASSQMRKGSKPGSSEEEGRRMSDEDNEFLEDMGVENEEEDKAPAAAAAAELEASSENQQWRELLADQRIQDLMANRYNQDQQQQQDFGDSYPSASSSSSSSSQSLDTRALTDYLVRTGEIDRTLHDLVAAGVMTSEEATLYQEAINLEYGASPQSTNSDQVVVDPEVIYDDGQPSEVLYDGPNYIQPFPVDYQLPVGDYLNLAPQYMQQQQNQDAEDEEEGETMGRSDGDYGQSAGSRFKDSEEDEDQEQQQEEATIELLRDLLGTIALQEDNGENLSYKSPLPSEMEVQNLPNLPSSTNQWSPVGKEVDDERGTDVEKELEALPTTGERIETDGTLEEEQLEEMRNRVRPEKTKQDNRTKPIKNSH